MCQAKRPTVQAAPVPTKPPAQFTTPDQLSGANTAAGVNANAAGRDSLRIDTGSAPSSTAAPAENDTVNDPQAEEAARAAQAAQDAANALHAAKSAQKKKFMNFKKQNLAISLGNGGGIGSGITLARDLQNNINNTK